MTYGGTLAASIVQGREGMYSHVSRKIHVSREQTKKWFYQIAYGMEIDPWVEHLIGCALDDGEDNGIST